MKQIRANNNTFPRSALARIAAIQNMHMGLVWSDGLLAWLLALAHFFRAVCLARRLCADLSRDAHHQHGSTSTAT